MPDRRKGTRYPQHYARMKEEWPYRREGMSAVDSHFS
jgi:hypothetical protein